MSSKKACFWAFFWKKKSFPGKTVDFHLWHALQILKAIGPEVNLSYQWSLLKHPTRRQNFANTVGTLCAHYLTLRLTCSSVFSTATFLTKTFRVAFLSSRPQSGSRQVSDWLLSGWLVAQEVFRHLAEEHGIGADKLVQMGGHGREYPTAYFCTKEHWPPVYHFLFKWHVLICPMITDNNVIGVITIQTFKQAWTYAVVSEIDTILFVPPFRWFIM